MEDVESGSSPQIDIGTVSRDEKILVSDNEYSGDDSFFQLKQKDSRHQAQRVRGNMLLAMLNMRCRLSKRMIG